jgi:undecaprenyl diphosphate synthase
MLLSSTKSLPITSIVPKHVAIIMDGNGRWAKKRFLPRVAGHQRGLESVRLVVKQCAKQGVKFLTLFAFSTENWRRPKDEVSFLMSLFIEAMKREIQSLHKNNVKFQLIGDRSGLDEQLKQAIDDAESLTSNNTGLVLTIAANYGGRWDVLQAVNKMVHAGNLKSFYGEDDFSPYLQTSNMPEPDLFIRTGGEQRISNFLLWQLAYTELYFTDTLWPDFDDSSLQDAFDFFKTRERRFGRTSDQLSE